MGCEFTVVNDTDVFAVVNATDIFTVVNDTDVFAVVNATDIFTVVNDTDVFAVVTECLAFTAFHEHAFHEIPTGLINGINMEFIFSTQFWEGSIRIYMNGLELKKDTDYQEDILNKKITFTAAPLSGDLIWGSYVKWGEG